MRLAISSSCGGSRLREQPVRSIAPTLSVARTARPGAAGDQALGEQRSGITVIERAVDVRRFDRNQPLGAHQPRRLGDDAHRHGRAVAALARGDRAFIGRQLNGH